MISGTTGAIAMGTPLAFAAIPGDGLSDVHGSWGKPGVAYPCVPGGGLGLFSCNLGGFGEENLAHDIGILCVDDLVLSGVVGILVSGGNTYASEYNAL